MIQVLFAARQERWQEYQEPLRLAFEEAGLSTHLATDIAPEHVDYVVYAPNSDLQDFSPLTKCKAVLNLWAGVETAVGNKTLTMPFARMVGGGLTEGMVEWVLGHVLRHHLGMDAHIVNPDKCWTPKAPPLASDRKLAVLGLGALGQACAEALTQIGFDVHGWARSAKEIAGVTCHVGDAGLGPCLQGADFVVLLLPDTPSTHNILNGKTLNLLNRGAFVINPGRGPLIDDDALVTALDAGQIGHATLDVFRIEPLPSDHAFWHHPQVTITPHVASETRATLAARVIAENIRRGEAGEPFLYLVDKEAGY